MNIMISTILIFPIVACLLVMLVRKKAFATFMVNVYAIIHFVCTMLMVSGIGKKSVPYFALDNTNSIFLIVLLFIFPKNAFFLELYIKYYTSFTPKCQSISASESKKSKNFSQRQKLHFLSKNHLPISLKLS